MKVDPAASMRCWALEVMIGGRAYNVSALTADQWWPVLADADPGRLLDLMPESDLDDRLLAGELDLTELGESLTDAVEEATGRSLHVSIVLAQVAAMHWPVVGGALSRAGFRWDRAPIAAALDAIYLTIVEGLDEEARKRFDALLDNESLTGGGKTVRAREKAMDDFSAMAGPKPSQGVRSSGGPSGSSRPRTPTQPRPLHQNDPSAGPTEPPSPPAGSVPPAMTADQLGEA